MLQNSRIIISLLHRPTPQCYKLKSRQDLVDVYLDKVSRLVGMCFCLPQTAHLHVVLRQEKVGGALFLRLMDPILET